MNRSSEGDDNVMFIFPLSLSYNPVAHFRNVRLTKGYNAMHCILLSGIPFLNSSGFLTELIALFTQEQWLDGFEMFS